MAIPLSGTQSRTGEMATEKRAPRSRQERADAWWGYFFIFPQFLGLLAFSLIPVVYAFFLSLVDWDGLGTMDFVGLANYTAQFSDPAFRDAMLNTAIYTAIAVPGGVALALLAALGVNKVRGKTLYRLFFFLPVVTSSVAVSMVWTWLLNGDFGLINTYAREWFGLMLPNWLVDSNWVIPSIAVVAIWAGLGFNMVIFLAGLQGIPATYLEAAQIDGASKLRQFKDVVWPLLTPTTFFVTIIAIISSFQVFDFILVMTNGGPGTASRTMVFHIYDLAFVNFTFGASAAAAVILFAIIMAVTLFQFWGQRRWVNYDI